MMELTLDKKHENKLTFVAKGIPVALANAVRRYAMVRVPVLAIDKVTFYENTTALFDEYLAHRLGLIPIDTPKKLAKDTEVSFQLDETGPKVAMSRDLKSSDKEIAPGREEIPIITLAEGQRLRLEGTAHVGLGLAHAKYQAGLVSYSLADNAVHFMVESFYHMPPSDVVVRGCDVLRQDLKALAKELEKAEKPKKKKK